MHFVIASFRSPTQLPLQTNANLFNHMWQIKLSYVRVLPYLYFDWFQLCLFCEVQLNSSIIYFICWRSQRYFINTTLETLYHQNLRRWMYRPWYPVVFCDNIDWFFRIWRCNLYQNIFKIINHSISSANDIIANVRFLLGFVEISHNFSNICVIFR